MPDAVLCGLGRMRRRPNTLTEPNYQFGARKHSSQTYVSGHMFSFFDCNDFSVISLKCQPERIEDLKSEYECIGNPYNESPKHWIGINPNTAPDDLLKALTRNSYEIVRAKYGKLKKKVVPLQPE